MSKSQSMNIPSEAVEAVAILLAESECAHIDREAGYGDGDNLTREDYEIFMPSSRENASLILGAAAPSIAAQAIEDALIDFGRSSVFLTAAQETMARFLRERVTELRAK